MNLLVMVARLHWRLVTDQEDVEAVDKEGEDDGGNASL